MNPLSLFRESDIQRFWSKVQKGEPDQCWPWTAGCFSEGYGSFCLNGEELRAHVIAYALTIGIWPSGLVIRHTCDNPSCVNPTHLIEGTTADNVHDMMERGRIARGEQSGQCKLSDKEINEIRRLGLFFGGIEIWRMMRLQTRVSHQQIYYILRGESR